MSALAPKKLVRTSRHRILYQIGIFSTTRHGSPPPSRQRAHLAVVASSRPDRYDVLVGTNAVARLLTRSEALACIMGAGGAFAVCVKH